MFAIPHTLLQSLCPLSINVVPILQMKEPKLREERDGFLIGGKSDLCSVWVVAEVLFTVLSYQLKPGKVISDSERSCREGRQDTGKRGAVAGLF